MDSMIERVARAMVIKDSGPEGSALFDIHWREFGSGYIESARAAIEAMRVPTQTMTFAGMRAAERVGGGNFIDGNRCGADCHDRRRAQRTGGGMRGAEENWLTPEQTSEIVADINCGRWPYIMPANDNAPRVIALSGAAGSGKSTAADYLVRMHGYERVKFAGPLKDMCRAIGMTESQIEGEHKERPFDWLQGKTPRHAMQTLGTEWGRKCMGEHFWIGLWERSANDVLDGGGRVVVDDCRFANEADAVRKLGGVVVRLVGRGGIGGGHASENMDWEADRYVYNDTTRERLYEILNEVAVQL